ncbi:MFS transporter [Microbacterium sp. zg-Y818]|uniref:MFS transporter n=1 Tax=unclassified Microbacterium TaxID=2609290 RepID=UPI00214CBF6D|nr:MULTISPECIES: MFS transporter [unclassified Microbacterium]MCR2800258.1 MFS transporter [Microbacterium sp. zg.Y818]WIM22221.1 MFS transporter [Microbacterium sp. zg-Y818]
MGPDRSPTRRDASIGLITAFFLIAANMRPTITAVGPLLAQIGDGTGLAPGTLGLLASVPLVTWALFSPLAHDLSHRFGMSRVMLVSLVLLAVGTIVRSLPGPTASLWIGAALIGIALAIVNVLMPAIVKREFPQRIAAMTAVYSALLGGFGAVASGAAVPISQWPWPQDPAGWRFSLLVTGGALLPFAIAAWAWAARGPAGVTAPAHTRGNGGRRPPTGIWTDRTAWLVAGYMGTQASVFYMLVTWLAPLSVSTGRSPIVAGFDVMLYQLFSIAGSLILPLLLRRSGFRARVPALIPTLAIAGILGLIVAPGLVALWAPCLGLSSGASLGMTMTLMAQRARDHHTAAALSGMAQSVGYLIAATGPVVFGWLHDLTGAWFASLALLLAVLAGQCIIGVFAGRERFVLDR